MNQTHPAPDRPPAVDGTPEDPPIPAGSDTSRLTQYAAPRLEERLSAIEAVAAEFVRSGQSEALHDLRVGLRTLRTVLHSLRRPYGRAQVEALMEDLAAVIEPTHRLRDLEVFEAWLRAHAWAEPLAAGDAALLAHWLERLDAAQTQERREVLEYYASAPLDEPLGRLRHWTKASRKPHKDPPASTHAVDSIKRRRDRLLGRLAPLAEGLGDEIALHQARIAAKRLRYEAEFYAPLLPRPLRRLGRLGRDLQGRLGELHDIDVFLAHVTDETVAGAPVPAPLRPELLAERARQAYAIAPWLAGVLPRLEG